MNIIKQIYKYKAIIVSALGTSAFFFAFLIILFFCTQIWNTEYKTQINTMKQEKMLETQKEKIDYLNMQIQHEEYKWQSEREKDQDACMIILGFIIGIPLFAILFIIASMLLDVIIKFFIFLFELFSK